jgi:hypothetical protein
MLFFRAKVKKKGIVFFALAELPGTDRVRGTPTLPQG